MPTSFITLIVILYSMMIYKSPSFSFDTSAYNIFSFLMNLSSALFLINWAWKNRSKIMENKQRIETFSILSMMGFGGVLAASLFGITAIVLAIGALTGSTMGLEKIPAIYHLPITIGVISICGVISYVGFVMIFAVANSIEKAIKDPKFTLESNKDQ